LLFSVAFYFDIQRRFGTTALMSAAAAGNFGGVKWLLQAGADATAADARGRTAVDYIMNPAAKVRPAPAPVSHMFGAHSSSFP
jgi:hypothetical protein